VCDTTESTLIKQQTQQVLQLQPGQVVKKVSVPYQVVGLVVGPKGTTIKRIQQNTNTYIVTPSRDSQPVFEIQGMPDNVQQAKAEIENYIQLRTNSSATPTPPSLAYSSCSSSSSSSSTSEQATNLPCYFGQAAATSANDYEFFSLDLMDELKLNHFKSMSSNSGAELANVGLNSSSIWASPSSNAFVNSEDCLVNSLQQSLATGGGIRSASSSSTSSSASSSFSLTVNGNKQVMPQQQLNSAGFESLNSSSFQFFNEANTLNGLISGMERMNLMNCSNENVISGGGKLCGRGDPFLGSENIPFGLDSSSSACSAGLNGYSASSSLSTSSSSTHNDMLTVNSLFQNEGLLFSNSINNGGGHQVNEANGQNEFAYLYPNVATSFLTNFQQQPQYF